GPAGGGALWAVPRGAPRELSRSSGVGRAGRRPGGCGPCPRGPSLPPAAPPMLAMQPHAQRRKQLLGIDRLGEIVGGARLQALLAVALHGFGSERNDRQPPERPLLPGRGNGLIP